VFRAAASIVAAGHDVATVAATRALLAV
jgi:hypothetical protein